MRVGLIIPFRGLKLGKSRLRAGLSDRSVEALSAHMLATVLDAAHRALPAAPVVLMTRDRRGISAPVGVTVLEEPLDLNDAVDFGRSYLERRGVDQIVVIGSDLAWLQPADIEAMLAADGDVVIAPDAAGRGTNALVFASKQSNFCRFGEDSAQRHAAEAAVRGLTVAYVHRRALSHDVDTIDQIDAGMRRALAPRRALS